MTIIDKISDQQKQEPLEGERPYLGGDPYGLLVEGYEINRDTLRQYSSRLEQQQIELQRQQSEGEIKNPYNATPLLALVNFQPNGERKEYHDIFDAPTDPNPNLYHGPQFQNHAEAMPSALEAYEIYKRPSRRPMWWDDKPVILYSYQVPWFATAMTDGKTVWLGRREEVYFAIPEFRINHEDPGHPMTFMPGWTEDDVDMKGQIYANVRSSNRTYTI